MVWLNHQKELDSVQHEWLLKLAKAPPRVISAIETLMQKWLTNLLLTSHEGVIQSYAIHYLRGIFQGDTHPVFLFILSVKCTVVFIKEIKRVANHYPFCQT